jgi:hypothetical protein
MAVDPQSVIVEVIGGPLVSVPWTEKMTSQDALENARDLSIPGALNFALEYFGKGLGYMVIMINGTFESFAPKASPNYYWDFLINNTRSAKGIDSAALKPGDKITFKFDQYVPEEHAGTLLEIKYKAHLS